MERRRPNWFMSMPIVVRCSVVVLAAIVVAAVIGPFLWKQDPVAQNPLVRLEVPCSAHPLGTDRYGRDVFARVLTGARWSLLGSASISVASILIGVLLGSIAAMSHPVVDAIICRIVDSLLAIPGIALTLGLASVMAPSFRNLILVLILTSWPNPTRYFRQIVKKELSSGYVEGARSVGASSGHILWKHLVPNLGGAIAVITTNRLGGNILSLASLSFLGLGMHQPTPEWGAMIQDASTYFQLRPLQMLVPGLCIAVVVLVSNLIGNEIRDQLDPHASGSA